MTSKNRTSRSLKKGLFITFEGVEGCGKTTQWLTLSKKLEKQGFPVLKTREPGGTKFSEQIRELMLSSPIEGITPICEAFLVCASRNQHIIKKIQPALAAGNLVLCDRFSDSTLAYQGYARGLNIPTLRKLNEFSTYGIKPDLTLLFDIPVSTGLARRKHHHKVQDRLDKESKTFHEKVRKGYLTLANRDPTRVKIIDGRKTSEQVAQQVLKIVSSFLESKERKPGKRPLQYPSRARHK